MQPAIQEQAKLQIAPVAAETGGTMHDAKKAGNIQETILFTFYRYMAVREVRRLYKPAMSTLSPKFRFR
jgi:hypothetical protein